jgi:signal transduction histidine kinase
MPFYPSSMRTRRDVALDTILAGSLFAWGQAEVWNSDASLLAGPEWANAGGYAIMSVLLLARRRAPALLLTGQSVVLIALVMAYGASETLGWLLPLVAGVYAVAAYGRPRRLLLTAAPVLSCYAAMLLGDQLHAVRFDAFGSLPFVGLLLGGWLLGDYARTRRLYLAQLAASAELTAREREEQVRRAAAEQRTRIAQELHDVLAHGMTVMVRQVEAGQARLDSDPARARASFTAVAETGRQSLGEVRRLVALLRDTGAPEATAAEVADAPPPGLGSVDGLAVHVSEAGLQVRVARVGELSGVPAGVGLAVYRIVQEALTNAMRHGRARSAVVTLRREDGAIVAEIHDEGCGPDTSAHPGSGLPGMRERAALYGGTVIAGPGDEGGFTVRAVLPLASGSP